MAGVADQVCLALVDLWQGITNTGEPLDGVQVVDGPQVNSESLDEWLFVAHDGDTPYESSEAAVVEQDWMAFARTMQEQGDITCAIVVRDGEPDIASARARAYAILSAAEDALRPVHELSGLVLKSWLSKHTYMPTQTTSGAKARIVFTVTYLAQL